MHAHIIRRLLAGITLAGLVGMLAGDPPSLFAQKKKTDTIATVKIMPDPTKKNAAKMSVEQLSRHIDKAIAADLTAEKTDASPRSSDEEFVRRVYLDLAGKIPTASQAVEFLDSKEPDKRATLIDDLLDSKEFGKHQADLWTRLLLPVNSDNRRLVQYYPRLKSWLEQKFNTDTSWDKIVKELMTSTGEVDKTSPAVYWVAHNSPDKMTDNVTRMFLGIQLQCAQCHNHPFTDYKQNEYWEMAAFFMKVGPQGNPKAAAKKGGTIKIVEAPRPNLKRRVLPESAKMLAPRFLRGNKPTVKPADPLRPVLADWMTSPKNAYFGRALTNRVWGQLFGRGFINPIDDMHDGNPNSHPELLTAIERQFIANDFDVKYLFRAICNSETYQRTSKPSGNNLDAGPELFARMAIKPLSGEQLFDALASLAGNQGGKGAARKGQAGRFGGTPRDAFIAFFAAEDGADPTEYHAGIPQVLRLMNAQNLSGAATVGALVRAGKNQSEIVEKMYLTVLARRPTTEERDRISAFLKKNKDEPRQGYAGVMWALLNSSEFALNR